MELSIDQETAIKHYKGPALVTAGPGSGKTCVIINRIRRLIKEEKVPPGKIITVTFSRAAAMNMERRFKSHDGMNNCSPLFSTIHSLSYRIINSDLSLSIIPPDIKLITDIQKKNIYKDILLKCGINADEEMIKETAVEMTKLKSTGVDIKNHIPKNIAVDKLTSFYRAYGEIMKKHGFYEFDDMPLMALKVIKNADPEIIKRYIPFEFLLIDEFQDTSVIQNRLLKMIFKNDNFFAVGDDDQSIYSFRGSTPRVMLDFKKEHKDAVIYMLTKNYRSLKEITEFSNIIISDNKNRIQKEIISMRTEESGRNNHKDSLADYGEDSREEKCVSIYEFETDIEELNSICDSLDKDTKYKHTGILTRLNSQASLIASYLLVNKIPFYLRGSTQNIFDNRFVKVILSFFNVSTGSKNRTDWLNVLRYADSHIPTYSLYNGKAGFDEIRQYVAYDNEMVADLGRIENAIMYINEMQPATAIEFIRKAMGVDKVIKRNDKENYGQYNNALNELKLYAGGISSIKAFLSFKNEYTRKIENNRCENEIPENGVVISSIHSSKGLEFDNVWIPFLNEKILPLGNVLSEEEIEEERRLFYVAATRAKDRLIISRHKKKNGEMQRQSIFLDNKSLSKFKV